MASSSLTPDLSQNPALTEQERQTVITQPQEWTDSYALKVAMADFKLAETYRQQNHDRRFRTSDELLVAWRSGKKWQGTNVPRSAMPIFLALEQIQALLPAVISALIGDNPAFDSYPLAGTSYAQAQAVRRLIRSQLRNLGDEGDYLTIREILRRTYQSSLSYGNGIIEFGWLLRTINKTVYDRRAVARTTTVPHPLTGEPVEVPTGQLDIVPFTRQEQRVVSKPKIDCTDIRDFYIDPNTPGPSVQQGRFCAKRQLLEIDTILQYANQPGFNIPSAAKLIELANRKTVTAGDQSKQQTETYRGNSWQPTQDTSVDPAAKRVEVIRYWTKERHVWVLGREAVAYNACNAYESLPFLNAFYVDVPGRFYGLSICDIVEGDQRLAQAILDARLDELNLLIHPPIIRRLGAFQPNTRKRLHPGVEWEINGDPSKDIIRMEMGNVTAQSFAEIQALELRVQKYTGVTDLAVSGVQSAGGNSANRTATGVQTQSAAANRRIQYQVENIEDQFMEPLLYSLLALNKRYLDPTQVVELVGEEDAQLIQLDPLDILNADVRFELQASQKMKTRQSLQSGGLQMLLEMGMNPSLMQELAKTGKTVDIETLFALASDTLNIPNKSLIRVMTPQEQQQYNQPPADAMLRMMMQRERIQGQAENQDSQDETKLLLAVIQKLLSSPDVQHRILGMEPPAAIAAKHAPKVINGKR